MITVGKTISILREKQGRSLEAAADRLGISAPALFKIETGATDLNLSRLVQIAELFGLSAAQLVSYEPDHGKSTAEEMEAVACLLEQRDAELLLLRGKVITLLEEIKMG